MHPDCLELSLCAVSEDAFPDITCPTMALHQCRPHETTRASRVPQDLHLPSRRVAIHFRHTSPCSSHARQRLLPRFALRTGLYCHAALEALIPSDYVTNFLYNRSYHCLHRFKYALCFITFVTARTRAGTAKRPVHHCLWPVDVTLIFGTRNPKR